MDPKNAGENAGEILKHLEKQKKVLEKTHKLMSHELHKLQVEEEMLMRKFYKIMSSHNITKKKQDGHEDVPNSEFKSPKEENMERVNGRIRTLPSVSAQHKPALK